MNMNLFPFYEKLIWERKKFTSLRLGDKLSKYTIGSEINITIGWSESPENPVIRRGRITSVKVKKIKDIRNHDLLGESPDCLTRKQVPYALSAIYRKLVTEEDQVTIVRWNYIE